MAYLKYYEGSKPKTYPITKSIITIGKSKNCDLSFQDPFMSDTHAQIKSLTGGYYIVDSGSKNGTMVNGKKIKTHHLKDGDVITVGKTSLTFKSGSYQTMRLLK